MKAFIISTFALIATVCADKSAPYPASGTKPNGPLFLLPARQTAAASTTKAPIYIYPYAPPSSTTGKPLEFTTAKAEEVEAVATTDSATPNQKQEILETGVYYILSPEGKLQKVEFLTAFQPQSEIAQKLQQYNVKPDKAQPFKFRGVVSNFQYKDVEPITAPIYSFNNVPGPLVRVLRRSD